MKKIIPFVFLTTIFACQNKKCQNNDTPVYSNIDLKKNVGWSKNLDANSSIVIESNYSDKDGHGRFYNKVNNVYVEGDILDGIFVLEN
ncbi:hypothetical protein BH10BAC1_BH10BAC1_10930 [soil metagenome]